MNAHAPRIIYFGELVQDFCGQDLAARKSLQRVSDAILVPAHDRRREGLPVNRADFEVLKRLVEAAEDQFALADAFRREITKPDQIDPAYCGGDRLVLSGEIA